ncbi:MAG TPA: copper resistance protein CopC [Acidimicrobiales bacterium]|nr:copper resistance protein CopC [Acidimicrobiales bacterium]
MKRIGQLLVAAVAVVLVLVGTAGPASAHAQLESTNPPASSVLLVAPSEVVLHFGEPVEIDFGSLRVLGPDGQRVDNGGTHHPSGDSHAVGISLPANLPSGTYVVVWRVISADSHPVHGAFVFSVGSASGARKASAVASTLANQSGSTTVGVVYWLIRFAAFVGLLFLVGLALMVALAWRPGGMTPRVGRILWVSWSVLLASTVLGIGIQGVYAATLPLVDIVRPSLVDAVLHTRFGQVELLRLLLLVAFIPVLLGIRGRLGQGPRRWRWLVPAVVVVGAALLLTPGLAGHASTGDQPALGLALDVTHLAAASAWLGGLALLATFLVGKGEDVDRPDDPTGVTLTVSAYAFSAVVVVVATGTFQSIRQVGSLYALFHTTYGRTLVVKIILVTVLIGLGALSRRIAQGRWGLRRPGRPTAPATGAPTDLAPEGVVPVPVGHHLEFDGGNGGAGRQARGAVAVAERPVDRGGARAGPVPRLRRSVLAEIGVALAVLGVTALLVNAVPAKQAAALPFSTSFTTLGVQVNAIVDPAKAGTGNQVHVYVLSTLGTPVAIPELDATLTMPAESLGPLAIPLHIGGLGHYYATNVDIPVAGTWILKFTVRTDAIDEQVVPVTLPVH